MVVIIETPSGTLCWNEEARAIEAKFVGFVYGENLRNLLERGFKCLQEKGARRYWWNGSVQISPDICCGSAG